MWLRDREDILEDLRVSGHDATMQPEDGLRGVVGHKKYISVFKEWLWMSDESLAGSKVPHLSAF